MWISGDNAHHLVLPFYSTSLRIRLRAAGSRHLNLLTQQIHLCYFSGDGSRAVLQIQLGPDLSCSYLLSRTQRQKGEATEQPLQPPASDVAQRCGQGMPLWLGQHAGEREQADVR